MNEEYIKWTLGQLEWDLKYLDEGPEPVENVKDPKTGKVGPGRMTPCQSLEGEEGYLEPVDMAYVRRLVDLALEEFRA